VEKVTRDVITDLWPLYAAGDVSADTRALIEAFLKEDPEFAKELGDLSREPLRGPDVPALSPDAELRTLQRVRRRLRGPVPLLMLAMMFSCMSFGTLVSDTSFDVSPRRFIVTALIAVSFWAAFVIRLFKGRREFYIHVRR
jgi:hypothetical protein